MKLVQQIKRIQHLVTRLGTTTVVMGFMLLGSFAMSPAVAHAAACGDKPSVNCTGDADNESNGSDQQCETHSTSENAIKQNCLVKDLQDVVNILAGLVAVVATASLIYAGIMYITAADNAQKVTAAKTRIYRTLFALISFFLIYAFLQYLIPGGLL